jgi:hypothetical protein
LTLYEINEKLVINVIISLSKNVKEAACTLHRILTSSFTSLLFIPSFLDAGINLNPISNNIVTVKAILNFNSKI